MAFDTRRLQRLKALEREELDAAVEEWARRELRPHGLPEWLGAQIKLWRVRLDGLAGWVQVLVKLAPVLTLMGSCYKLACFMWAHYVKAADLPATGIASTTLDRVEKTAAGDGAANPSRRPQ
jgi:hypothetical protein